jgi:hypothetical protein
VDGILKRRSATNSYPPLKKNDIKRNKSTHTR